jgi:hypothetical protein
MNEPTPRVTLLDGSEEPDSSDIPEVVAEVAPEVELAATTAAPRPKITVRPPPARWSAPSGRLDDIVGWQAVVLAGPVSLLPEPWRKRLGGGLALAGATIVTGAIELVAAVFGTAAAFTRFSARWIQEAAASGGDHAAMFVQGGATWIAFLLTPTGLALTFLFCEGLLRAGGTAATGEPLGIGALWAVERIHRALTARARRLAEEPLVEDAIVRDGEGRLTRIESCRPRPWDELTTVSFEDHLYAVVAQQTLPTGPRRHLYRLQLAPANRVVRGLHHYAPDELLLNHKKNERCQRP